MKNFILLCCLFVSSGILLFGQTGPAGVGSATNNINWHIADSVGVASNAAVSTWSDLSGNGNDLSQTGTARPLYRTTFINGHAALDFDGVNDHMDFNTRINEGNFSFFIVFQRVRSKNSNVLQFDNMSVRGTTSPNNSDIGVNYPSFVRTTNIANNTNFIFSGTHNNLNTNILNAKNSNYLSFTRSGFDSYTGPSTLCERFNPANSNTFYLDAHVAEVILFNEVMDDVERSIIDNYLASKYNIAITNDRYAFDLNHGHGIIGIGQTATGSNSIARGQGKLRIANASDLNNNEFMLIGHDNAGFGVSNTNIPVGINERWSQTWRVDKTLDPGLIDLRFYIQGATFASAGDYRLIVDTVDADFTNGGNVIVGSPSFIIEGGQATINFTGVNLKDGAFFTLAEVSSEIIAIQTGSWSDPATWSCNCIPAFSNVVSIGNNHRVIVNRNDSVGDLTIEATGQLDITSDTLSIFGNFETEGTFQQAAGTVSARKSTGEQIFTNLSPNIAAFFNLHVENDGLTFADGGWTLSNNLQVVSGGMDVSAADSFLLRSTPSSTSQVLESMDNAFTGDFIVERYISPRNSGWSNISSPITGATIAELDDDLLLSGINGRSGDIVNASTGDIFRSVTRYQRFLDQYFFVTSTAEPMEPGEAFEYWLATNSTNFAGATVDFRGPLNNGTFSVQQSTQVNVGFNLVGNPYHAFIDFEEMNNPTLEPYFYIYNTNTANYDVFTTPGTPLIAPEQGFWVFQVPTGNNALDLREGIKGNSNSSAFLRKQKERQFALELINHSRNFSSILKLDFSSEATDRMDHKDIRYLKSPELNAPSIYSHASNSEEALTVNSLNNAEETQVIPVTLDTKEEGLFSLNAQNLDELYSDYSCVFLKDKTTNELTDLSVYPELELKIGGETELHYDLILSNNFEDCLARGKNNSNEFQKINESLVFRNANGMWYLDYTVEEDLQNFEIAVYNTTGQLVIEEFSFSATQSGSYIMRELQDLNGIFVVRVVSQDQMISKTIKL